MRVCIGLRSWPSWAACGPRVVGWTPPQGNTVGFSPGGCVCDPRETRAGVACRRGRLGFAPGVGSEDSFGDVLPDDSTARMGRGGRLWDCEHQLRGGRACLPWPRWVSLLFPQRLEHSKCSAQSIEFLARADVKRTDFKWKTRCLGPFLGKWQRSY